jgi:hypothetical protein
MRSERDINSRLRKSPEKTQEAFPPSVPPVCHLSHLPKTAQADHVSCSGYPASASAATRPTPPSSRPSNPSQTYLPLLPLPPSRLQRLNSSKASLSTSINIAVPDPSPIPSRCSTSTSPTSPGDPARPGWRYISAPLHHHLFSPSRPLVIREGGGIAVVALSSVGGTMCTLRHCCRRTRMEERLSETSAT